MDTLATVPEQHKDSARALVLQHEPAIIVNSGQNINSETYVSWIEDYHKAAGNTFDTFILDMFAKPDVVNTAQVAMLLINGIEPPLNYRQLSTTPAVKNMYAFYSRILAAGADAIEYKQAINKIEVGLK